MTRSPRRSLTVSIPVYTCTVNRSHTMSLTEGEEDFFPGPNSKLNLRYTCQMLWEIADGIGIPSLLKMAVGFHEARRDPAFAQKYITQHYSATHIVPKKKKGLRKAFVQMVKVRLFDERVVWVKAGAQTIDGLWAGIRRAVSQCSLNIWRLGITERNLPVHQWKKWLGPGAPSIAIFSSSFSGHTHRHVCIFVRQLGAPEWQQPGVGQLGAAECAVALWVVEGGAAACSQRIAVAGVAMLAQVAALAPQAQARMSLLHDADLLRRRPELFTMRNITLRQHSRYLGVYFEMVFTTTTTRPDHDRDRSTWTTRST